MVLSDERYSTRSFVAGNFKFVVEVAHDEDRQLLEALFGDLPEPSDPSPFRNTFTMVRQHPAGGPWLLRGPRLDEGLVRTFEGALVRLMAAVNLSALDADPKNLHLHAAAATKNGQAVVIAAERNTGKSTTVAQLVNRGWSFVTDETVCLSPGSQTIGGWPKPLSVKPGGTALVRHLEPWMIPAATDGIDDFRFVPVGATGVKVADRGSPRLVILLRRTPLGAPAGEASSRRLHAADAVVEMMQQTLDAQRFGPAAVRLAELAARSCCFELTIGTPAQTADEIEHLFGLDPPSAVEVFVLPRSDAFSPGVSSILVGGRGVIHDASSGKIFALDEGGTRVWKYLGGWSAGEEIDLAGPVIQPFVAELHALGVLAGAA